MSATSSHIRSITASVAAGSGLARTFAHVSAPMSRFQSDHWAIEIVVDDGDGDSGGGNERVDMLAAAIGAALNVVKCEHAHTVAFAFACVCAVSTVQPATDHAATASSQKRHCRAGDSNVLLPFGMRIAIRLVGAKPDTLTWRSVPATSNENETSGESAVAAPSAKAYTLRR